MNFGVIRPNNNSIRPPSQKRQTDKVQKQTDKIQQDLKKYETMLNNLKNKADTACSPQEKLLVISRTLIENIASFAMPIPGTGTIAQKAVGYIFDSVNATSFNKEINNNNYNLEGMLSRQYVMHSIIQTINDITALTDKDNSMNANIESINTLKKNIEAEFENNLKKFNIPQDQQDQHMETLRGILEEFKDQVIEKLTTIEEQPLVQHPSRGQKFVDSTLKNAGLLQRSESPKSVTYDPSKFDIIHNGQSPMHPNLEG